MGLLTHWRLVCRVLDSGALGVIALHGIIGYHVRALGDVCPVAWQCLDVVHTAVEHDGALAT